MLTAFLLVFVPLFVAIDSFGTLPMFLGMTEGFTPKEKKVLARQAVVTAFGVGCLFCFFGPLLLRFVGITASDFRVAGGLLLLVFSVREIFGYSSKSTRGETPDNLMGIVPLGIPLIAGPAMITTVLILRDEHPIFLILAALVANLLISWVLFSHSEKIVRVVGDAPCKVIAKIIAIFLAAIGVMMIRRGWQGF